MTLEEILAKARDLAVEYYNLTGKPLGITGEVAEYEAARVLGLELCGAREPGCDAVRSVNGRSERLQIKGRWFATKPPPGARVGRIDLKQDWDFVILVILDQSYRPVVMYEAPRDRVTSVLQKPGSKSRTERGQMSISQFKAIGRVVWYGPYGSVS